ncbi:NOTCH2 [Branchiostoma lanceolatum]|uniref:NOTCH2 protein n=1 Tax=Branchiostoma lanceolatum TaxID=7740 RepID=A0A8J9ZM19_BRALA|nr:NOTCH2 [Branchiostoma lanceolatum]
MLYDEVVKLNTSLHQRTIRGLGPFLKSKHRGDSTAAHLYAPLPTHWEPNMSPRLAIFCFCCAILALYSGQVSAQSSGDGEEQDYSGSGGGVTGTGVYYNPGGSGDGSGYGPSGSGYGSGYGPSGSGYYGPGASGDYDGSGWAPDPVYYGLDPNGSCSNSPCQNNAGCCEAPEGGWHCYCLLGYEEPDCSHFNDPCSSASGESPCMNGGTCYYDPASSQAACVCPTGFAGVVCEFSAPTDCNSDECQNGGTCLLDSYGFAVCTCPDGFSGSVCEFALGQCEEDICENGHCVEWICAGYYACNCDEGYSGTFCDVEGEDHYNDPDYQPSGSGDYGSGGGVTGTGVYYNPGGSGDGPSGSGYGSGYGPSGSGDYGPSGSGDYGPSGSGDYGPSGSGDYGPSGSGDYGPSGSGDYGPSGSGDYGPSGSGDYGPSAMYYGLDPNGTCSDSPCQNSVGCCEAPEGGWYCACLLGYEEPDCSYFNNNPCNSGHNPCMNGGDCYFDSYSNQASCHCQPGFTGPACEFSAPTDCSSDECQNGGTCTMESYGDAWCACPEGFSGPVCEFALGQCEEDICVHGDCVEWICAGYYACNCDEGYSGTYCDVQHNETDGCSSSPCQNGASCCEDPEGGWYCDCPLGYQQPDCATFNDPCAGENPCMQGGTCQFDSTMPDYAYCQCPHGFTGKVCETTVPTDCTMDECQNGATCQMDSWGGGDVWCVCPDGFTGPYCEFLFGDCQEDSCEQGDCHPVGCEGYHTCECEEGYSGTFCEVHDDSHYNNTDGCSSSPCQNGASCCEDPEGGWYCDCPLGYEGPDCATFNDPCAGENPCVHGGTCQFDSTMPDYAYCQCPHGFTGKVCETTVPTDCTLDECQNGAPCEMDSWGGGDVWCVCPDGFTGPYCEFLFGDCQEDSCEQGNCHPVGCEGYHTCECEEGYSGSFCEISGSGDYRTSGSGDYGPSGSGDYEPSGSGDYGPSGSGDYEPSGSGDYGPSGSGDFGSSGSGDYGPSGSGDYGPSGSGDYGPSGSGDYGPSGSGDYGPSGSGDYGPSGSGDEGPNGSGDEGPSGSGDEGPSGSGDYGPSGSGDDGPSGSGDYGPSGSGDDGPSGSGDYGPSGSGDDGPSGSGDDGPSGSGDYGPSGSGDDGPSGSGDEGPNGSGDEGSSGSGDEGLSGSGDEGPNGSGDEEPSGSGDDGPYTSSEGPEPYTPSESPEPYTPSEGPEPYYTSESPGPYYTSDGPNPTEGPGPNPTEGPVPTPTEAPGPNPLEDSNLYPFGPEAGDQEYEYLLNSGEGHYWGECLEQGINDEGFPFFGKRHYKLYVCDNGMISFETPWAPWIPYLFGTRRTYNTIAMTAPFWAMSDASSLSQDRQGTQHSHIYFHSYAEGDGQANTEEILNRAGDDANDYDSSLPDFRPTWALVVTWVDLPPYIGCSCYRGWGCEECDLTDVQTNTFQTVLMTNALHSFSKVIYPEGGLNWVYPGFSDEYYQYFTDVSGLPWPVAGFSAGDEGQNVLNLPTYSGTQRMHLLDEVVGNTGYTGQWMVRMEDSDGTMDARLECLSWYRNQADPADVQATLSVLPPDCPCTEWQLWFDGAFQIDWSSSWWDICAYSAFPTADGLVQKCCYEDGALKTGGPDGGYVIQNREDDDWAYTKCCVESVGTCDLFYEKRPSANCSQYLPPIWSWTWGDPHITTLDGKRYTFNGKGEYIMADVDSGQYQVQARTAFPEGTTTATAFSAMVIQKNGGVPIQVNIASDSETGMNLYIDGALQDMTVYGNVSTAIAQESNVLVSRPSASEFKVYYSTGVSATAQVEQGMMSIVFSAPVSFMGKTKGLLGVWDGDQANDFMMHDGTVLSTNSTERQIFDFGRSWQVTAGAGDKASLFHYDAGQGVDTYQDDTFVPTFGDEAGTPDPVLQQQAEEQCGDNQECVYDVLQTGNVAVGAASLHQSSTIEDGSQKTSNYPPTVTGPTVLYAVYQQTLEFSLTAEDRNGDSVSFSVSSPSTLEASVLSASGNTATFSWRVDREESFNLKILVTDAGGASALYWPTVYLCSCENDGSCATSGGAHSSSNNTRFVMQECTCAAGYTGSKCESDIDACVANFQPCYADVRCIDLPAPANISGYQCDSCPTGYAGDGQRCADVDECASGASCAQLCVNFPGSYQCSCNAGYELGSDGSSCNDVDECTPASDCDQVCNNNAGSYSCSCNSGFELGSDSKSCTPTDPCPEGDTGGCDVIRGWCLNNGGTKQCACKSGYALAGDGVNCNDVDECQTGENSCNQNCANTDGSYNCSCESGYELVDEHTCQDIDECNTGSYNCTGTTVCKNQPGSYSCECAAGLVLTNGACVDLPDDEKPVSVSTRTPSDQDLSNAVTFNCGITLAQYTVTVDNAFSALLAAMATEHCTANAVQCGVATSDGSRRRRRSTPVTFTVLEVQRPSGYPSANNDSTTALAYYLLLPSGNTSIPGSELLAILQSNVTALEAVLGGDVSTIALLVPVEEEGTVAAADGSTAVIVVAVLVPLLLLVVAIAVGVYMYKKSRRKKVGLSSEDVRMEPVKKERVATRAWGPLEKGGGATSKPVPPTWAEQAAVGIGSQPVRAPLPPVRAPTFVREGTQGSMAPSLAREGTQGSIAPSVRREGTHGSIANPAYQSAEELKSEEEPKVSILQLLPSRLPAPPTETELYPKPPGTPEGPETELYPKPPGTPEGPEDAGEGASLLKTQEL